MLVLLGPRYSATSEELTLLTAETGLTPYDLRMRLRPGAWSVVRAFADQDQATRVVSRLASQGLQCCALNSAVGMDPSRPVVYLREIVASPSQVLLLMAEREMSVPLRALLTIVRGDVHLGRTLHATPSPGSSSAMRAATPISLQPSTATASEAVLEQRAALDQDVFVAADLHFVTVPWIARIDARDCAIEVDGPQSGNYAERLDAFIDALSRAARIRVDRDIKISNLALHATGQQRQVAPNGPISTRRGRASSDEYFDAYSRLIGEAERQTWTNG